MNSNRGIEHGFTIDAPPQSAIENAPLRLRFEVSGDLELEVNSEGSGAAFKRETDNVLLSYDKPIGSSLAENLD
ncbi:MAG: hypothetical protein AABO41_27895 [Acidobacteriota bacterium]